MPRSNPTILILGAGINGAALARELALNGVRVVVVDTRDAAAGTTAYSSRLVHGGLRYLEYAEFDLVRESLAERTRWLRLAPHLVRPLRLFVPIRSRGGGLLSAARHFLHVGRQSSDKPEHRGLWAVGTGLWLYDRYARDPALPRRKIYASDSPEVIPIDREKFRWLYAFSDAQLRYPERFTLALLADARSAAEEFGGSFELHTYHQAIRNKKENGNEIRITPVDRPHETTTTIVPAAIINATGPWVDRTLNSLELPSPKLIGGVKGSHFLTSHAGLHAKLAGRAIYGEATDGRPVFVLPFGSSTLVGTTEVPLDTEPADAVASPEELSYLIDAVNGLFADLNLTAADIDMHYSGVRPLPATSATKLGAVTRRHWLEPCGSAPEPFYSLVGGKLTTCRSLAEEGTATILARIGVELKRNTRERPLPGGENYPADDAALAEEHRRLAEKFNLPLAAIERVWSLVGSRTNRVLSESLHESSGGEHEGEPSALLPDTNLPLQFIRWSIRHEWPASLDDLVERRLMLHYEPKLSRACLSVLAKEMAAAGKLRDDQIESAIEQTITRLSAHFGKRSFESVGGTGNSVARVAQRQEAS